MSTHDLEEESLSLSTESRRLRELLHHREQQVAALQRQYEIKYVFLLFNKSYSFSIITHMFRNAELSGLDSSFTKALEENVFDLPFCFDSFSILFP